MNIFSPKHLFQSFDEEKEKNWIDREYNSETLPSNYILSPIPAYFKPRSVNLSACFSNGNYV